jgi:4-hydroxy-tetrahydrodipicolinate synthase
MVDYEAMGRLIESLIEGKIDYLVVLGTTGESATLSAIEKNEVLDFSIKQVAGRIPIVAGFGGNNTASVVKDIQGRDFTGIDAILSVSPYYNKPSQAGIFQHYKTIADNAPVPVIVYNVPSRTSSNITAATTLQMAKEIDGIVAVKEASGDLVQCMEIVQGAPDGFLVISGDDVLTLPMLSMGMHGVISVVANRFPGSFSEMVRLGLAGDFKGAGTIHYNLLRIMDLLFREGNPAGIKASLAASGMMANEFRLPVVPVTDGLYKEIADESSRIGS